MGGAQAAFLLFFGCSKISPKETNFSKTKQSIKWNIPGTGVVVWVPTIVSVLFQTGHRMLVGACGTPSLNRQAIKLF